MRRIAELPPPWRYVLYALALVAVLVVLRWVDREDGVESGRTIEIHLKLRGPMPATAHLEPLFHSPRAQAATDVRSHWYRWQVSPDNLGPTLAALHRNPAVEEAFIAPQISLPSGGGSGDSCPITTPSFESYQEYVGPAPKGIDAPEAWRRGVRGKGVWFADIEGAWNVSHEDLPGDRITHAGGEVIRDPSWRAHGTAVLGEVIGRDNGKGVVGLAPDVERVFTSSIGGTSVADAIDTAAEQLRPGDVLLIELQGAGPRGRYLPVEWWDDNYDAIAAATERGIVVIEAAGNGGENLDHSTYKGKLSRSGRDSGAIMVGAGAPPRKGYSDRARLDFSNYGTRVDVQGWGRKVATLDYGDLQNCSDDFHRHYTGEFSGTSSASPIVAGAAVLVESYKQRALPPRMVRDLLRRTGTPQAGNTREAIGPRPDLARALQALD